VTQTEMRRNPRSECLRQTSARKRPKWTHRVLNVYPERVRLTKKHLKRKPYDKVICLAALSGPFSPNPIARRRKLS